jgi:hypothetical protein
VPADRLTPALRDLALASTNAGLSTGIICGNSPEAYKDQKTAATTAKAPQRGDQTVKALASLILATTVGLGPSIQLCFAGTLDVSGKWISQTGAVYGIAQTKQDVSAIYFAPNAEQVATGIRSGDSAFTGRLTDRALRATFYQRIPACHSRWSLSLIEFMIARDGNTMEGDLPRIHVDDNCVVDESWSQHLVLRRSVESVARLPTQPLPVGTPTKPHKRTFAPTESSSPAKYHCPAGQFYRVSMNICVSKEAGKAFMKSSTGEGVK